jgi:O-glycosyl hydrolase
MGRNLFGGAVDYPVERPKTSSGRGCDSGFQRAVFIRSQGAEVSRDTSPVAHTYVVKCEKPKRQRNQAAEETKVTREFGIRNGGSGRCLQMVRAVMRTRRI